MSHTEVDSYGKGFSFANELLHLDFGDKRLNQRFIEIISKLEKHPSCSIHGLSNDWSEAVGAYRLFENNRVTTAAILNGHRQQLIDRIRSHRRVICPQDTTSFNFGSHMATSGLGSISQGKHGHRGTGLFSHTNLVLSEQGVPLGILDQNTWSRAQLGPEDDLYYTEQSKWLRGLKIVAEVSKACENTEFISVGDRESDFDDAIVEARKSKIGFLIRAKTRRVDKKDHNIAKCLKKSPALGELLLEIPRKSARKGTRGKRAQEEMPRRTARLKVSAGVFNLKGTYCPEGKKNPELLQVTALLVEEVAGGAKEPIRWLLFTSMKVSTFEDACEVIRIYKMRWEIETFHKIVKSGCQVERCLLGTANKLKKFILTTSLVAWRIHHLTQMSIQSPEEPCLILRPMEMKALLIKFYVARGGDINAIPVITLSQVTKWIAQLGGYKGRKHDKKPGAQTMWRGWQRLMGMAEGMELALQI